MIRVEVHKLCLEEIKVVLEVVGCRVPMEYRGSAAVLNPSRPFGVVSYAGGGLGYLERTRVSVPGSTL